MDKETILLISFDYDESAYWLECFKKGLESEAFKKNFIVKMVNKIPPEKEIQDKIIVIFEGSYEWDTEKLEFLHRNNAKIIIAESMEKPLKYNFCHSMVFGLKESIVNCIDYLCAANRKNIILLGISPRSNADKVKRRTFTDYIETLDGVNGTCVKSQDSIHEGVKEFVRTLKPNENNAVICVNDTVACCLEKHMLDNGFSLPEDLFIIGMGNTQLARYMQVPITSVSFDYTQMGRQTAKLITKVQKIEPNQTITISLNCDLVVRESTACIKDEKKSNNNAIPYIQSKGYFEDDVTRNILLVERMLQNCDDKDRHIIYGLACGERMEKISEDIGLTDRSVRYRIKNIVDMLRVNSKKEAAEFFRKIIKK